MKKSPVLLTFIITFALLMQQSFSLLDVSKFTNKCLGDINQDKIIDIQDADLMKLTYDSNRGEKSYNPHADFDNNGVVDINDASVVGRNYGKTQCHLATNSLTSSPISTTSATPLFMIGPLFTFASPNSTFQTNFLVFDVQNFVGADFNLTSNSSLATVNYATFQGTHLFFKPTLVLANDTSTPGEFHFAFVILGENETLTGSYSLLQTIYNTTANAGNGNLDIHGDVLVDVNINPIPHTTQDGFLSVIIFTGGGGGGRIALM